MHTYNYIMYQLHTQWCDNDCSDYLRNINMTELVRKQVSKLAQR
jgi:hypothetical protein